MDARFFVLHFLFGLVIALLSACVTFILVRHLKALDIPNERSSHTKVTPRGGGLSIAIAFLVGISLIQFIGDKTPIYTPYFRGFLFSSFVIAALSLRDDFYPISFIAKLGGHIVAIIISLSAGIVIDMAHLPFGVVYFGFWAYPLTFLWILGLTNTYNFIDGLDGLAASTAAIAALFLAYISFQEGSHFIYLASLVLAAASFGFLIFNWSPAKIFMGDIGSTFLGFTFSVMAVLAARYDHSHTSLFVVPLLLFHFIFDAAFTFLRRLLAGEHVFTAHRSHLYQLLNRMGYTHQHVALIYSMLAILQGLAAIWMMQNIKLRVSVFFLFFACYLIIAKFLVNKARRAGLTI